MEENNNWLYDGIPFDDTLVNNYQGFVYFIENLTNGKFYIGKKTFWFTRTRKGKTIKFESDWKKYYGSSEYLKEDIDLIGKEHFKRYIVNLCKTKGEMNWIEAAYQFHFDVLSNEMFYNNNILQRFYVKDKTKRVPFSENIRCFFVDDELIKIRSKNMCGDNNPAKREEVRKKISEKKKGEKHHQYGKPISCEHKQKLHDAAHEKRKRKVIHNGITYNSMSDFINDNKISSSKFYTMLKKGEVIYEDGNGRNLSKKTKEYVYNDKIYKSIMTLVAECHISTDTFYKLFNDGIITEWKD